MPEATLTGQPLPSIEELLARGDSLSRSEQQALTSQLTPSAWRQHHDELLAFAERRLHASWFRDALDVLATADTASLRVVQLKAWALRASGAPRAAAAMLAELRAAGARDEETLGMSGSAEKDLARQAPTRTAALEHWENARRYYAEAFAASGNYWTGINAAALALRCGRPEEARALAGRVSDACESEAARGDASFYTWATLGQAALLLGETAQARDAYARAAAMPDASVGKIGRDKREAEELLTLLDAPSVDLDELLPMPRIVVFAGCRVRTADGISRPAFGDAGHALLAQLQATLDTQGAGIGYAAAADGSDIVFLEALASRGGELNVVLPADVESFRQRSVEPSWHERFDAVLARAHSLTVTSDGIDPAEAANLSYCSRVTLGMAQMNARELSTTVQALAVWDDGNGTPGGTRDSVALWQAAGLPVTIIDAHTLSRQNAAPQQARPHTGGRSIKAMLKADVIGYSRLSETEVANFYNRVLPRVAELLAHHQPLVRETFGDAFYFVFERTSTAAAVAFELRDVFVDTSLRIRIALHAGPLLECYDPIAERVSFTGRHASRVARVEPVADENQILATQQFAALSGTTGQSNYEYVYAGERVLPKGFGVERLYVVTRR